MFFTGYEPAPSGASSLVVVLHGLKKTAKDMADVISVIREAEGGDVDIFAPTLPYSKFLDSTGADAVVRSLVADLDEIWANRRYDRVIFVGHSIGGVLTRRVFLAGAPRPPDYSGPHYSSRDDLRDLAERPHGWASRVERIVVIASWDKGWSVSERGSWYYNIGLDFLGFVGRVAELIGWEDKTQRIGRTMLDARRGAPFIVQTRLLWMAYRRWRIRAFREHYRNLEDIDPALIDAEPPAEAVNPLVVQIVSTLDDFVSPQDQVDADADGASWGAGHKAYGMMETPDSDHVSVIEFGRAKAERTETERTREAVFKTALTWRPGQSPAPACLRDPTYFADMPTAVDDTVENVVFVMHGIRDDGYWTHRIAKAIKEEAARTGDGAPTRLPLETLRSLTPTYGYFPMGAFIMPWVRRQKVEWFMDLYVNVKSRFPKATMHYVGHSNGTYLAATALTDYAAARFGRIYFAGSVVHPAYDWSGMLAQKRIWGFHNARGGEDWVVAFLPKSLEYFSDLGGGGFDGFDQLEKGDVGTLTQSKRFAKGGHSGAITEPHWPEIAKFIAGGAKPFTGTEATSPLFADRPDETYELWSRFRIAIPLLFALAALVVSALVCLFGWVWRWDPLGVYAGWRGALWLAVFGLFLAGQFHFRKTPPKYAGWALTALLGVMALNFAVFILTSLGAQFADLASPAAAVRATTTLALMLGLVAFILRRF